MTLENPKIFIIIPAWNEEKNISSVLSSLIKNYENIVIIDDGSSDKTIEIAKQFPITILNHIINRGQGAALQTGNEYAIKNNADIIVHFDGDGQFLIEEINDLINPIINEGYDIVFGSRFMGKESKIPWLKKNVLFKIGKIVNILFFKIKTTDPQSGFRAMTRSTAEKIKIEHDQMAHCSEILHKSFKHKLKIKEVPMTVIYNKFGQNFSGGAIIIKDLIIKKILR